LNWQTVYCVNSKSEAGLSGPGQLVDREGAHDRARGILIGLAAGDRIGGPVRMAMRVAESLAETEAFEADDVLSRYLAWYREGAFDTGRVAEHVLRRIAEGKDPYVALFAADRECAGRTAGCSAAHRIGPIAMASFLSDEQLPSVALEEARLTHLHPLAGDVAAATAVLCRALIRGRSWSEALAVAAEGRLPETVDALLGNAERNQLRDGGFAPDVLQAAVLFTGQAESFEGALAAALAFAGTPNYSPVLVGAIAGARWGAKAIPERELAHCDVLHRVATTARDLAAAWDG
jgi:ADP-ribosyl-[dinitrogen reductase] hydrolase